MAGDRILVVINGGRGTGRPCLEWGDGAFGVPPSALVGITKTWSGRALGALLIYIAPLLFRATSILT